MAWAWNLPLTMKMRQSFWAVSIASRYTAYGIQEMMPSGLCGALISVRLERAGRELAGIAASQFALEK